MKNLLSAMAVVAVLALVSTAGAAEPAKKVSRNSLSAMGLSGMTSMSTEEGAKVRGSGLAVAGGISYVNLGVTGGTNFHFGASATTNAAASGYNYTVGGVIVIPGGAVIAGTGGASGATAK